jgi:succinyl-CoA:(S)-malate CoA-transferase subunit B
VVFGTLKLIKPTPKSSETPGQIVHSGPALGANTDEVLTALGKSQAELAELRSCGDI